MSRFYNHIKNFFFLLLIIQFLPFVVINIKKQYTQLLQPQSKVGMITFNGMLTDAETYLKTLRHFFKNSDIKAVVLYYKNGLGGVAGTAQALFQEINHLKTENVKPVIAFVENTCASADFYVACSADVIVATPSSFVGSIGVYIPQPQLKEFIEQFKISYDVTKTGSYKAIGDPFLKLTPEQQNLLQELTNDTYDQFIHDVAKHRSKLSLASSSVWADGKIFTGRQALSLGLIDEIGSITQVEHIIKQKTSIEGVIKWVKPSQPSTLSKLFGGDTESGFGDESYLETATRGLWNQLMITMSSIR